MPNRPIRLPPLKALRVRNPNRPEENPCVAVMSSVLTCWASAGYTSTGCAAVEQALRTCMDGPKLPAKPNSAINYHLARFQKRLEGPTRREKPVKK
ncbi:mitochondrial ribosomal protein 10 [Coniochaeta sp. 2T2.1]|nr:mitochondrial ribosomal protein 10 [Coniochaeta sp. 2T2.1]